jgi:hypothetical protein
MKRFCFHDWHPWSALVNTYNSTKQFRACKKCNKVVIRRVACSNDTNPALYNSEPPKDRDNE